MLSKSSLKTLPFFWPEGRLDSSDVWNLRAVFSFLITFESPWYDLRGWLGVKSKLALCLSGLSFDSIFLSAPLFCLVLLLILSSPFCFWPSLLPTLQKFLSTLFFSLSRDRLFCIALVFSCFFSSWEMISWSEVSLVTCYLMALVLLFMHLDMHLFLISWW